MHDIQFTKFKTKKNKDLKQDLQVLLWMLGLGFPALTLFFCHSSKSLAPFSNREQWGFQHFHQPNFSYLFPLHILLWLFSWMTFLLNLNFFFNAPCSTFEDPCHLHLFLQLNAFFFFSLILFSYFFLHFFNLCLQNGEFNKDNRNALFLMA